MNLCPRLTLFKEEMRLFSVNGSMDMRYGLAYHRGQEGYYKGGKDVTKGMEAAAEYWAKPTVQHYEDDYRTLEVLLTALMSYDERYRQDTEKMIGEPEQKVIATILLTDEEKSLYGDIEVRFVAVIDLMLELDGAQWVVDFKSTKSDLPYMASKLRKMAQLMGYQFVARSMYPNVTGCLVDYYQCKAVKSRSTGLYGPVKTDFMKFPMIFSSQDYKIWRQYIIWNAFKLNVAKKAGYPPEYGSCYAFNKTCDYLPLCDHPKWDLERFKETEGFVVVPDDREAKEVIEVKGEGL
jgi:hypothetical protein